MEYNHETLDAVNLRKTLEFRLLFQQQRILQRSIFCCYLYFREVFEVQLFFQNLVISFQNTNFL